MSSSRVSAGTSAASLRASRSSRFVKGTTIEKPPNTDGDGLWGILSHPLNGMLIFLPLGWGAHFLGFGEMAVFWLNFLALVPLAKILGDATEELAAGLQNDMLAGLLNATFGNAVEMVIMVQTLRAGLMDVVKATLLGSVLSNVLLVPGTSFFLGGILGKSSKDDRSNEPAGAVRFQPEEEYKTTGEDAADTEFVAEKVQSFSIMTALVNTSMLLLACLALSLVTIFYREAEDESQYGDIGMSDVVVSVSRVCSIIMMVSCVAYIFFQLVTHREALAEEEGDGDKAEEEASISITMAVGMMIVCTLVVAFSTELLVSSLEGVVGKAHISKHFIGIILLPIVGNACEHASAVRFAIMDKPGLAIGIAVGSSTQISMFVVPFSVIVGWIIDKDMDLNFGGLNTTVLMLSIVVVLSIVVDGTANWLQGWLLISAYFMIIGVLYYWMPNSSTFDE